MLAFVEDVAASGGYWLACAADEIFIDQNSDAIHIFGEVGSPGLYFPNLEYSLTELLSTAGLNRLTANAKNIYTRTIAPTSKK